MRFRLAKPCSPDWRRVYGITNRLSNQQSHVRQIDGVLMGPPIDGQINKAMFATDGVLMGSPIDRKINKSTTQGGTSTVVSRRWLSASAWWLSTVLVPFVDRVTQLLQRTEDSEYRSGRPGEARSGRSSSSWKIGLVEMMTQVLCIVWSAVNVNN